MEASGVPSASRRLKTANDVDATAYTPSPGRRASRTPSEARASLATGHPHGPAGGQALQDRPWGGSGASVGQRRRPSPQSPVQQQQQQPPHAREHQQPAARGQELLMSQYIKSCTGWEELREVFHQYGGQLNRIHITALLSGLAKMAPSAGPSAPEYREYRTLVEEALCAAATVHVGGLGPREISTVLWAAAKAGARPPPPSAPPSACWLPPLLARASQLQLRLNPQDISMLLWALATLSEAGPSGGRSGAGNRHAGSTGSTGGWSEGGKVFSSAAAAVPSATSSPLRALPPSLLRGLLASAATKMDMFGPQAISNTLWALAKLGCRPDDAWLDLAMMRMEATMASATPQGLANAAWALVVLERRPPPSWRAPFLLHATQAAEFASPGALAQLAWAAAKLHLAPGPAFLAILATRAAAFSSSSFTSSSSSSDGPSSGHGSRASPHGGTEQYVRQQYASPQDVSNVLWALAVGARTFRPLPQTMAAIVAACMEHLQGFSPNELCSVVWSLAKLGYVPSVSAMQRLQAQVAARAPACSAQGLVNVLWAVVTLKAFPEPQWVQELLSTLSLQLDEVGPQELANLWWALGAMRWRLGPRLREDLAGELRVRLEDFNVGETAMVLWALARLGLQPHREALLRHLQTISRGVNGSVNNAGGGGGRGMMSGQGEDAARASEATKPSETEALGAKSVSAIIWAVAEMQSQAGGGGGGRGGPAARQALREELRLILSRCLEPAPQQPVAARGDSSSTEGGAGEAAADNSHRRNGSGSPPRLRRGMWFPRELATCLNSCARMGLSPPADWTKAAVAELSAFGAAYSSCSPSTQPLAGAASRGGGIPSRSGPARSAPDGGPLVIMRARDAAMAAHGLAGVLRQASSSAVQVLYRGATRSAPPPHPRMFSSSSLLPPAPPQGLSECVLQLVRCAAADVESVSNGELAMLLSALPELLRHCVATNRTATGRIRSRRLPQGGQRQRQRWPLAPPELLQECMEDLGLILAACQQRMQSSKGGMAPREATAVVLAAARLGITIDTGFAVAIMDASSGLRLAAACEPSHMPQGNAASGLALDSGIRASDPRVHSETARNGSKVTPGVTPRVTPRVTFGAARGAGSCRNWIVCLWALERSSQPRGDGLGLLGTWQGRAWLSAISPAILQQLSRAARFREGRGVSRASPPGQGGAAVQRQRGVVVLRNRMPKQSRPGGQSERSCHVASWGELAAGSAAAARLAVMVAGMAAGGIKVAAGEGVALSLGADEELARLAWVLRQVAGRMRQVAASSSRRDSER